jgi:ABC-type branched-subunit amino acid transport system permease subunit
MRLKSKSQFAGLIDLADPVAFYYLALALMLLAVFVVYRLVNSRFGMVLRACKSNEGRSRAIGFSPYPYRLAAFVIAGALCGLAGALYANHTSYIVPGLMSWQQSGDMMFMVILGGMASTAGPVLGTRLDGLLGRHARERRGRRGDDPKQQQQQGEGTERRANSHHRVISPGLLGRRVSTHRWDGGSGGSRRAPA